MVSQQPRPRGWSFCQDSSSDSTAASTPRDSVEAEGVFTSQGVKRYEEVEGSVFLG